MPDTAGGGTIQCKACQQHFTVTLPPPSPPPDGARRAVTSPEQWPRALRVPGIIRGALLGLLTVLIGLLLSLVTAVPVWSESGSIWAVVGVVVFTVLAFGWLAEGAMVLLEHVRATARPSQDSPDVVVREFVASALGCREPVAEHAHRAAWSGFYLMAPDTRQQLFANRLSGYSAAMRAWRQDLDQEVVGRFVPAERASARRHTRALTAKDLRLLTRAGGEDEVTEVLYHPAPAWYCLDWAGETRAQELFYEASITAVESAGGHAARVTCALQPYAVARPAGPRWGAREERLKALRPLAQTFAFRCVHSSGGWSIAGPPTPGA